MELFRKRKRGISRIFDLYSSKKRTDAAKELNRVVYGTKRTKVLSISILLKG